VQAVVWHGLGDIRMGEVPEPTIQVPVDANENRLPIARGQGAEVINFEEDVVQAVVQLTGDIN